MAANTRRINYYELLMNNDLDCIDSIKTALDKIDNLNLTKSKKRLMYATGGGDLQIKKDKQFLHYYHCYSKIIRDEFPEITNRAMDTVESLEAEEDLDKGVHDESHFVISVNPNLPKPIIAIESSMKGPKQNDIRKYLNGMLTLSKVDGEFQFEPVFAFKDDEFINRIEDVAKIKMVFHQSDIDSYSELDDTTGHLLRTASDYSGAEYITLDFSINFQKKKKRYPTLDLKRRLQYLVNILSRSPQAKDLMRKFEVRAEDKNQGGKLRLFDLIESKIASEVVTERRRPRSKYFKSTDLYEAITKQIEADFS